MGGGGGVIVCVFACALLSIHFFPVVVAIGCIEDVRGGLRVQGLENSNAKLSGGGMALAVWAQ